MKKATDFQKSLTKMAKDLILEKAEENHKRVYGTCASCGKEKENGETWYRVGQTDYQACCLNCKWDTERRLGIRPPHKKIDTYA